MIGRSRPWAVKAKCLGLDPNLFIPNRGGRPDDALAVCNGTHDGVPCPVREQCRAAREETNAPGVWGGEFFSSKESTTSGYDEALLDLGSLIQEIVDSRPRGVE